MGRRKSAYTIEEMSRRRHEADEHHGEEEGTDARSASPLLERAMLVLRHSLSKEPRNV